jgi:hypothetical protein
MQLGEVPSTNSGAQSVNRHRFFVRQAAAASLSAPVSKATFSTEWIGNRRADFDRSFSCCI